MPGRVNDRTRRRMPCDVTIGGRHHNGLVINYSPSGLFIQTSAKAKPGDRLDVQLSLPGISDQLTLQVEVVRKKVVPPQLRTVAGGGLGVRIVRAPEEFYRHLGAAADAAKAGPDGDAPAGNPYCVRVSQISGPRSRRLRVVCADEEEARREALEAVGEGWKVLEVEPA